MHNNMKVNKQLKKNTDYLDMRFKDCGDIVSRTIEAGEGDKRWKVYISYVDNLSDRKMIEQQVVHGFMVDINLDGKEQTTPYKLLQNALITADFIEVETLEEAITEVLSGNTLVLADGYDKAISVSSKEVPSRGVNKPEAEISVQGSQDSFTEAMRINTVLIRRRIRDADLKCVQMQLGKKTKTDTAVMYMKGTADDETVGKVMRRLKNINADSILDSGYIEQYIQENKWSPFPQLQLTERPDKAAAGLMEGRVAIVCDNSPFVILAPAVLFSFYQASEDYYQRWEIASFVRLLRIAAGFVAFTLPGLYIAVTMYDPSMLPPELSLHLAGARMGVPVSTMTEVIGLELAFETLREAGIRMPAAVGGTLGVVGGIIIGQAAVDAGLVSPMVVIVTAITGICGFAIPSQQLTSAFRLVKFFVIVMSAVFGIYGFAISVLCVFIHLTALESFGMPYVYPFGNKRGNIKYSFKDTLIRMPIEAQQENEPAFKK